MKITLVRHTRVALPQGTCYGWSDVPVADSFEVEAKQTFQNLKTHEPFDAVFSSPLQRARQLAAFCGFPDAMLDERLKEMNMGEWELQRYDDLPARDPYILEWYDNYLTLPTPKGESFPQLYARVTNFLEEVARRPYNRVAIFAHGGSWPAPPSTPVPSRRQKPLPTSPPSAASKPSTFHPSNHNPTPRRTIRPQPFSI